MAYTLDFGLSLGASKTGLTDLRAQLVDTSGVNVGAAVSTGFVEIGTSGNYLWHYTAIPAAHRGGVKFYSNAAPTVFLAFSAINPEEFETGDTVLDGVIEGSTTLRQSMRIANAANAGKTSGAGTTNFKVRNIANSVDRIDTTCDSSGNRTAVTLNVT